MPVSVNMPQRTNEKDTLDRLAQGLQIANSIYGMKNTYDKKVSDEKDKADAKALDERDYVERLKQQELENQYKERKLLIDEKAANKKAEGDPLVKEMQHARLQEMRRKQAEEAEKAAFAKTPEGRLQKLGAEGKQRFDNAKLGLISVQGMADALNGGQNTFSLFGDNDFTQQRALFEEALGRMQSGGAISKEEERRFKDMAPTFRDSAQIQAKKLEQLQNEMISRLGTLGFKPEEAGVKVSSVLKPPGSNQNIIEQTSALTVPKANAAAPSAPKPHPMDNEALQWAQKNKNDPRAAVILKANGM